MESVPPELLRMVAYYLDDEEVQRLRETSKLGKQVTDDPVFAKDVCKTRSREFSDCGLASFFSRIDMSEACDRECQTMAGKGVWKRNMDFASWLTRVQHAFIENTHDGTFQFVPVAVQVAIEFKDGTLCWMTSRGKGGVDRTSGGVQFAQDGVNERIERGEFPDIVMLSIAPKRRKRKLASPRNEDLVRLRVTFFDGKEHIGPKFFVGFTGSRIGLTNDDRDIELHVFRAGPKDVLFGDDEM